jgi:hypothetical protein
MVIIIEGVERGVTREARGGEQKNAVSDSGVFKWIIKAVSRVGVDN